MRIKVVYVFPPGKNGGPAVKRRKDGETVVFVYRKEERAMMGEEILKDVDIIQAYDELSTEGRRWIGNRVHRPNERNVSRKNCVICSVCVCPRSRLGERGGDADSLGEFPISDLVHDVGEYLDGKVRGKDLSHTGLRHFNHILLDAVSKGFSGKMVSVDVELSETRS